MEIALIILIPVMSISTGCLVIKAYSKGLKKNFELKNNIIPKEDKNPIVKVIEGIKEGKQEKERIDTFNEWTNTNSKLD